VPLRLGVRSRVREQRADPASGSICDAAAPRPVPHHRSGDRGRAASPQAGPLLRPSTCYL